MNTSKEIIVFLWIKSNRGCSKSSEKKQSQSCCKSSDSGSVLWYNWVDAKQSYQKILSHKSARNASTIWYFFSRKRNTGKRQCAAHRTDRGGDRYKQPFEHIQTHGSSTGKFSCGHAGGHTLRQYGGKVLKQRNRIGVQKRYQLQMASQWWAGS